MGKIKKNLRVGIRFSSTELISVFVHSSTTHVELQNTILQKIGVAGSKRVAKLFYRAPVSVVSEHVKYGSFVVQSDTDLEVIFHCWRDFTEVRITKLYAKLEDVVASSGGFNPNPTSNQIGCDLGDNRTFGELVAAVANSPRNVPRGAHISEPKAIEEALGDDENDEEPEFIAGDSDNDHHSIPTGRGVLSSSGSREYPAHFSTLDLEAVAPSQEENDASVGFGGGGSVDVLMPNKF
ncbi:hypothetical protein PIB30_088147 [Stylosanthes scabra]|uniref:Uncharacterized protein n=1 Tax=Stylosanthes scabra TaxID=79078 RepID=A0ABU6XU82_9FABA|nr:hypothetical protein [Stylosanthes scabra]